MIGTVLLVILVLILLGALPTWGHSKNWGYGPSGILGVTGSSSSTSSNERWVCHGGRRPKWKKVALPAVAAHRRHGDTVVDSPRRVNTACIR